MVINPSATNRRRIVTILRAKRSNLADDDDAHMQKVAGYVHPHLAQGRPAEDVKTSRWRFSLQNWSQDPHEELRLTCWPRLPTDVGASP